MNTINTANVIGKAINTGSGKRNTDAGIVRIFAIIAKSHPSFLTGLRYIHAIRTNANPSRTPMAAGRPITMNPYKENSVRNAP